MTCTTTHHAGCACHEARRDEEIAWLREELERWRHGRQAEGDYVCPDSLRAEQAERERDEAVADRIKAEAEERRWHVDACESEHRERELRAENERLREALTFGVTLLEGHSYRWEHDGDEESGQHDEDCRACEYEAMLGRFRAALSPRPATTESVAVGSSVVVALKPCKNAACDSLEDPRWGGYCDGCAP